MDEPTAAGAQPAAVKRWLRRAGDAPWLHGEVAARMAARLDFIKARPTRVLDWWSALGGSAALAARLPGTRIARYEPTAALAARHARRGWARWLQRMPALYDDAHPVPAGAAELLWSNMMLHWLAEPLEGFARWHAALAVDGYVMFSCFGPDTLGALRPLYRRLGWGPPAHDFIDMHDLGDALLRAGFAEPVMDMERIALSWADAAALLAELRTLGGNAAGSRCAGLRTPRWRAGLERELTEALTGPDGRLALGFEIVYGHAIKPAPRVAVAAETRIDAEALRAMARRRGPPRDTPRS